MHVGMVEMKCQGDGDPRLAGSCGRVSCLLNLGLVSQFIWGGELGSGGCSGLCSPAAA